MRRVIPALVLLGLAAISLAQTTPQREPPILVLDANGHAAAVRKVLFTPDGQQVVTVSQDKTIRLWDVASGETIQIFRPPIGPADQGALYAAALSPDGKFLAVGGMPLGAGRFGILVHVLSLETGRVRQTLIGHSKIVVALAFSPDGKQLASASNDATARIHDVATGNLIHELKGHGDRLYSVVYSPDGKRMVTASRDKTGRIWSTATGKLEAELKTQDAPIMCVAWSPDGKTLAAGAANGTICLHDPNGTARKTHSGLKHAITSLTFTPDGKQLLYTGTGGEVQGPASVLIDAASGKEIVRFAKHTNTVMHGDVSPDGKLIATTGGNDHETFIWKASDGSVVQELVGKGRTPYAVGWGADGKTIAWGTINRGETDKATMPLQRTFRPDELDYGPRPDGKVRRAILSRGSRSLKLGPSSTMVVMENGKEVSTFKAPLGAHEVVYCFTMLAEDRAAVGTAYGLYLVDLKTNQVLRKYRGHSGILLGVASSPDDRYFVSSSGDQTLRIWDVQKEEPLLSLFFAGDDWIVWTPQGYYAASANGERLMGWQVNKGVESLASYYPPMQFRRSLYQPEVIKQVLRLGSVEQALLVRNDQKTPLTLPILMDLPQLSWHHESAWERRKTVRAVGRNNGGQAFQPDGQACTTCGLSNGRTRTVWMAPSTFSPMPMAAPSPKFGPPWASIVIAGKQPTRARRSTCSITIRNSSPAVNRPAAAFRSCVRSRTAFGPAGSPGKAMITRCRSATQPARTPFTAGRAGIRGA